MCFDVLVQKFRLIQDLCCPWAKRNEQRKDKHGHLVVSCFSQGESGNVIIKYIWFRFIHMLCLLCRNVHQLGRYELCIFRKNGKNSFWYFVSFFWYGYVDIAGVEHLGVQILSCTVEGGIIAVFLGFDVCYWGIMATIRGIDLLLYPKFRHTPSQ